jgi:hypothetical protein
MATHYFPIQGRGQVAGGPTTPFAVAGITASAVACAGLCLSAALHIFARVSAAPVLAESSVSSPLWMTVWNIFLPVSLLGITLVIYRSWRKRANAENE